MSRRYLISRFLDQDVADEMVTVKGSVTRNGETIVVTETLAGETIVYMDAATVRRAGAIAYHMPPAAYFGMIGMT